MLGYIGSGKGTVSDYLVNQQGFTKDSFASSLKDACAEVFDWPRCLLEGDTEQSREWREKVDEWWAKELGIPNFSPRLALQLIGTEAIRNNFNPDIWLLTVKNRIQKRPDRNVVIADVRFPNEIKLIRELGGTLVHVKRGPDPVWASIAAKANAGDDLAMEEMLESFPEVHESEWAWAGTEADIVLHNEGSLDDLYSLIDSALLGKGEIVASA
jgi:hypothetical protein